LSPQRKLVTHSITKKNSPFFEEALLAAGVRPIPLVEDPRKGMGRGSDYNLIFFVGGRKTIGSTSLKTLLTQTWTLHRISTKKFTLRTAREETKINVIEARKKTTRLEWGKMRPSLLVGTSKGKGKEGYHTGDPAGKPRPLKLVRRPFHQTG